VGLEAPIEGETFVAQIDFTLQDRVPNEFVRVNPLGGQISYFRVDQAFEELSVDDLFRDVLRVTRGVRTRPALLRAFVVPSDLPPLFH